MTMGFWKEGTETNLIISPQLVSEAKVKDDIVFTGMMNLEKYAGLDPAFSEGGDNCVLRICQKGHLTNGQIVVDFKDQEFLYYIKIQTSATKSPNVQIAEQVLQILKEHQIPLTRLALDATGQGRALADVIALTNGTPSNKPLQISSMAKGQIRKVSELIAMSSYDLWFTMQQYLNTKQIRRLDQLSINQLTTRKVLKAKNGMMQLESKADYKVRIGAVSSLLARSPDEADAATLALQAVIREGGVSLGLTRPFSYSMYSTAQNIAGVPLQISKPEVIVKATMNPRPYISMSFTSDVADWVKNKM
jgi:hypothetical protein